MQLWDSGLDFWNLIFSDDMAYSLFLVRELDERH
jgi:hypothetical protein